MLSFKHAMVKNVGIVLLIILVFIEALLIVSRRSVFPVSSRNTVAAGNAITNTSQTGSSNNPYSLNKGTNLSGSPVSSKAFKVFPGDVSSEAKDAMDGWSLQTKNLSDGTTEAILTPKGSEDMSMHYILRTGNSLYFVELNKGDDDEKAGVDKNLHDDYGIIVDKNGIVQ